MTLYMFITSKPVLEGMSLADALVSLALLSFALVHNHSRLDTRKTIEPIIPLLKNTLIMKQ